MLPEDLPLTPPELTKLFKAAGYGSHQKAAKALGVDKSTIGKWCRGELKLSEESAAAIRALQCAPGAERSWNTYLAEVPVTIATFKARIPAPAPTPEPRRTLLKQNANEVADAVVAKAAELFATVKNGLDALIEAVQGLSSKVDSQSTQDAQERTEDRAKRDELGNGVQRIEVGVQQLQAAADDLRNDVQQLQARAGSHRRESRIQFLAVIGTMAAGFVAVIATVVACTHSGGPIPGDGLTRGGGVTEEVARGGSSWMWGDRLRRTFQLQYRKTRYSFHLES